MASFWRQRLIHFRRRLLWLHRTVDGKLTYTDRQMSAKTRDNEKQTTALLHCLIVKEDGTVIDVLAELRRTPPNWLPE